MSRADSQTNYSSTKTAFRASDETLRTIDLLIIDELGYLPIASDEANLLFQLINGRYERKSTIITTNIPLSSWGTVLHNPAAAEAILDRLVYHSHVIKIKGKSYRLAAAHS